MIAWLCCMASMLVGFSRLLAADGRQTASFGKGSDCGGARSGAGVCARLCPESHLFRRWIFRRSGGGLRSR